MSKRIQTITIYGNSQTAESMYRQLSSLLSNEGVETILKGTYDSSNKGRYLVEVAGKEEGDEKFYIFSIDFFLNRKSNEPYLRDIQRVLYDMLGLPEPEIQ